jgi:O-antigen/teichoic acid export membrane protein
MAATQPTTRRSVSVTVVVNYLSFALALVLAFLLSPLLIRSLGDARYGAWVLIGQLTGYYALLDFGLRGALAFNVASRLADGRVEDIRGVFATAFWSVLAVAVAATLFGVSVLETLPRFFALGDTWQETRPALIIALGTVTASLVLELFSAVLQGIRRPYLSGYADLAARVVSATLVYVIIISHGGLVQLSAAQLLARGLAGGLTMWAALRLVPSLSFSRRHFRLSELRSLLGFGGQSATINVAQLLISRVDLVVAGSLLNMSAVTRYSIGQTLVVYAWDAVGRFSLALTPHFTHLHARGDRERCESLYLTALRICGLLTVLVNGYLVAFGSMFLALWLGPSYVTGPLTLRSDAVMLVLVIGLAPRMFHSVTTQLLFGTKKLRSLVWLRCVEGVANLALSLLFARHFAIVGIALGTMVPSLVTNLVLLPVYVKREFEIPWSAYWAQTVRPVLVVGILNLAIAATVARYGAAETWAGFLAAATPAALTGGGLFWALGLTPRERRDVVARGRSFLSA